MDQWNWTGTCVLYVLCHFHPLPTNHTACQCFFTFVLEHLGHCLHLLVTEPCVVWWLGPPNSYLYPNSRNERECKACFEQGAVREEKALKVAGCWTSLYSFYFRIWRHMEVTIRTIPAAHGSQRSLLSRWHSLFPRWWGLTCHSCWASDWHSVL